MNSFRIDRNSVIRFLLISPISNDFYIDILINLQFELKALGHEATIITHDLECIDVNKLIQKKNIEVVFQINALRLGLIYLDSFQDKNLKSS